MVLTAENYYSQEANEEYMSVSQFKDFCGTYGKMPCEFTAMEKLKGRWEEPKSKALMVGSYVDSYFEGTLDKFKAENPDLFKRDGTLKAEFVKADEIIQRIERDDYFMKFMSGEKQVIMTGELFGTKWKIKMDSYIPGIAIVAMERKNDLQKRIRQKRRSIMKTWLRWHTRRKQKGRGSRTGICWMFASLPIITSHRPPVKKEEAQEKAVREKWCCTCEYYIPVDPYLPGFVTAYPECEKGRNPVQSCEEYRRKGCAIRNSPWADRIRERFMKRE